MRLRQKCLSVAPNASHEIAGCFGSGEGGALSRPSRNALNIVRLLAGLPHRAGKTSLNGIGSRLGGFRRVSLTNVTGFYRAGESATKDSCHRRSFGLKVSQGLGPGVKYFGFRTTQESGADLDGTRAQCQRGGYSATVSDATGGDDWN